MYSKTLLIGNLGRDPEVKYLGSGTAVCNFTVATSRKFKKKDSAETTEETTWIDVEVWGNLAEVCGQYLAKGRRVFVDGRLKQDSWDDKETGKKRTKLKLVGEVVQFLSPKGDKTELENDPAPEDVPF